MSDAWTNPLLPPAQTRLEAALAHAFHPNVTPEVIRSLWNPQTIPAHLLPWLAWALSVDEWDETWPEATQRAVCAASLPIHMKKGTAWAVRAALEKTGYRSQITEWWQETPRGTPHTFRIDVEIDDRGLDAATIAAAERRIDNVKPVRSHYTLRCFGVARAAIHHAAVTLSGEVTEIQPYSVTELIAQPSHGPRLGIGHQDWMTTEIRPQ